MIEYYGQHFNHIDCEILALARIPTAYRKREAALLRTKWFDYRLLHPVKATYLYAHYYQSVVVMMYGRTKNIGDAHEVKAFSPEDVFKCTELLSFWKARQALDELGVRYDFGLQFAMNKAINNGWRFFPRPNQMLGEETLLDIKDAWSEECDIRLQLAQSDEFKDKSFVGSPAQVAYREFLISSARRRANKIGTMATLLKEGFVSREFVEKSFDPRTAEQAMTLCKMLG